MASSIKSKKGKYPRPGITFGSEGLQPLTYTGDLPLSLTGGVTGNVYKWTERREVKNKPGIFTGKPTRQVDVRDVESIVKQGGGWGKFMESKPKPGPKPKDQPALSPKKKEE